MNNKKFGFTLAEVLITLAIIGVVAALTLPTLITNYKEKQTVTALKLGMAQLTQAFHMMASEHGGTLSYFGDSGNTRTENGVIIGNELKKYLSGVEICDGGKIKGCIGGKYTKTSGGAAPTFEKNGLTGVLHNGIAFWVLYSPEFNLIYGQVGIDTNGNLPPNKLGKDFFFFFLTREGNLIPGGSKELYTFYSNNKDKIAIEEKMHEFTCSRNSDISMNGYGCTGWALDKGNLEYLRKDIDIVEYVKGEI